MLIDCAHQTDPCLATINPGRKPENRQPKRQKDKARDAGFRGAFENIMTTSQWTPDRIQQLIALWNEGLSTSEIGRRLGVTKNSVVGKVHRLGLKKRASPIRTGPSITTKKPRPASPKVQAKVDAVAEARAVEAAPAEARPVPKKKPGELVRMEALRPGMCNWPVGEPGADDFHFCGEKTVPEKPYCAEHCERAYVKSVKKNGRTAAA